MTSLAVLFVVAAATVSAEPDEQPNPLQQYADDFIGTMENAWTPTKDSEKGDWKAGDKVPIRSRTYWELDKAALGWELSATLPITNKQVIWAKGFYAWNAETKQVILYSFGSGGNINQMTYRKEGHTWIGEGWTVTREGERRTKENRIEILDNGNTHILNRVINGETKDASTWKRTSGAEE